MINDETTLNVMVSTISQFVKERLIPIEEQCSETDQIPHEIIDEMKNLGLFGLSIPEEYDGLGLTLEEEINVVFVLCQASPIFRSVIGTNVGIGALGIVIDGTEEQKKKYLPGLASGEIIGAFALTEPDAGSDAASLRTTALKDVDHYVINGTKRFITNAPEASLFTVFARTNLEVKGAGGISAFLVDKGTPGLSLGKNEKKMGQWGGHVCDVIFDNCRVPANAIIGHKEGIGFKTAMKVLDKSRTHIAAVCVGAATRILDEALRYATERKQFNKPIAEFQLIQAMLADSKAVHELDMVLACQYRRNQLPKEAIEVIGRWLNVEGNGEHEWGYDVILFKLGGELHGWLEDYSGLVGDGGIRYLISDIRLNNEKLHFKTYGKVDYDGIVKKSQLELNSFGNITRLEKLELPTVDWVWKQYQALNVKCE